MSVFLIVLGIAMLYMGGELLVKYSVLLAKSWNISSLVIGLTVVAFGTSTPELASVLVAAFKGIPEMALGSIVGSNIANIGLIIGISAMICPLKTEFAFIRREVPIMVVAAGSLYLVGWNGYIGRIEGLILLACLAGYLITVSRQQESLPIEIDDDAPPPKNPAICLIGILFGIIFLMGGAHSLVTGAEVIARAYGVPEKVIGLTLVAFGTSLPELASCAVAAFRKEADIILGNIIGSNIFNSLAIIGAATLVYPIETPFSNFVIDYLVMMVFCLIVVPFLWSGLLVRRWEGLILFCLYIVYVYYLYNSPPQQMIEAVQ